MCTAITYKTADFYFGRTLDYDISYSQQITIVPRKYPLPFREMGTRSEHYAMIGMAHTEEDCPLFFDAVNETGLAMAGLNFVGFACYAESVSGRDNVAHFEFIPWVLSQCACVREALDLLKKINITNTPFSASLPPAQLHWILADSREAITVEVMKEGLRVYPNPVGVLTNNPSFDDQLFHLNNFMHLSPGEPHNHFSSQLDLRPYSRGMGAMGLPGDLSSQSRFVRAAFTKLNAVSGSGEVESVSQFFHILGTVSQVKGCCRLDDGNCEVTLYTSCCNASKGIYYYTTYHNHQICAVDMHRENLNGTEPIRFSLLDRQQIRFQN